MCVDVHHRDCVCKSMFSVSLCLSLCVFFFSFLTAASYSLSFNPCNNTHKFFFNKRALTQFHIYNGHIELTCQQIHTWNAVCFLSLHLSISFFVHIFLVSLLIRFDVRISRRKKNCTKKMKNWNNISVQRRK